MNTKKCFKCQQEKPISEFYKHPRTSDRHLNKCKSCTKSDVKSNYDSHREKYSLYEKLRNSLPERKAYARKREKLYAKRNPQKYSARNILHAAVRDGKLKKLPCRICGNLKSQAHHHDYSKPLDVDWLCFKHHREVAHSQVVLSQ